MNMSVVRRWAPTTALVLILIGGTGLRLYHTSFAQNVDEPNIIKRAVRVADGHWHIRWYNWPAQSLIHLDGVVFRIAQLHPNTPPYQENPKFYAIIAHGVTTFFALITLVLIFFIGRSLRSPWTGVLATLFLSVSYLHVLHSRFATPDVPMTAAFMALILIALSLMKQPCGTSRRVLWLYAAAGAIAGFAIATKYTGLLGLFPIAVAHFWRFGAQHQWKWRTMGQHSLHLFNLPLLAFFIALVVSHIIWNPFAFADWELMKRSLFFESSTERLGFDWGERGSPIINNGRYYLLSLLSWNGSLITLTAYATMLYGLVRIRTTQWRAFSLIPLFFFCTLGGLAVLALHWSRWAIPFTPLIAIAAAVGMSAAFAWLRAHVREQWRWVVTASAGCFIVVAVIPQLLLSVVQAVLYQFPTSMDSMEHLIRTTLPVGSVIAADTYHLRPGPDYTVKERRVELYDTLPSVLKENGFTHVIVKPTRLTYAKKQPNVYPQILTFFDALNVEETFVGSVGPSTDAVLTYKRDWSVYQWLWRQRGNLPEQLFVKSFRTRFNVYAL